MIGRKKHRALRNYAGFIMQIKVTELAGIYPAIITPMNPDGQIDYSKLDRLVEDLVNAGVQGICACGTTGQSATLDHDEHVNLAIRIKQRINGRCQYIAAAGSNNTREALTMSRLLEEALGPTTFLHVTGYYNNPPQQGLIAHFETLADQLTHDESNIILYNVPGRTSNKIEVETTIKLASHPRIIGIKEASGNLADCKRIIENTDSKNFRLLSGECDQVAETIKLGGFGAISATANVAPRLFVSLCKAALAGNDQSAQDIQEYLLPAIRAVFKAKNPIPLSMLFNSGIRLPMVPIEAIRQEITDLIGVYSAEELGVDLQSYRH